MVANQNCRPRFLARLQPDAALGQQAGVDAVAFGQVQQHVEETLVRFVAQPDLHARLAPALFCLLVLVAHA